MNQSNLCIMVMVCVLIVCVSLYINLRNRTDHFSAHTDAKFPPNPRIALDGKTLVSHMDTGVSYSVYTLVLSGVLAEFFMKNKVPTGLGIVNFVLDDPVIFYVEAKTSASTLTLLVNTIQAVPMYKCGLASIRNNPPIESPLLVLTSHCNMNSVEASNDTLPLSTTSCVGKSGGALVGKLTSRAPPSSGILPVLAPNFTWQPDDAQKPFRLPVFSTQ